MAVVAVLLIALDLLVLLGVRANATANANKVFDEQVAVVTREAEQLGARGLADRLRVLGIDAVVIAPDGTVVRSDPPGGASTSDAAMTTREVLAGRGLRVFISTPSAADDPRFNRVLVLEVVLTPVLLGLAALLLRWIAAYATKPLAEITARARRTTHGSQGERLQPDRPHTRLGQMAVAYDDMLDSLEGAVAEARSARAESDRLERRTHKILETAHEAFLVMGETGNVIDWNAEAERMFGWPRDEILGRSWEEALFPDDVRDRLRADRQAEGGSLWPYGSRSAELVCVRRGGERFPGGVTVWITDHEGVCTFNAFVRDFTERQRAEEATTHLAAIVESSDLAMLSTDQHGTVLTWNPAAERMYGYSAAEAVGHHLTALTIPEKDASKVDEALATVARGEVIHSDNVVRRRRDGSTFPVSVTIAPLLDSKGAIYGACSVARDMTEELRMTSQLDASLQALAAAAEDARASEVRTRRFLDDAAHQLRSPITTIRACADTLSLNVTPEQHDRLLAAVCSSSERASRLMAGLLRMARLNHEQAALEVRLTDLLALCELEADRAQLDHPDLDITAATVGPPLGPVLLPRDSVGEILSNLVDNAARHARSRIQIVTEATEDGVELRVVDDGPGLPDGQEESVFERFVSLDHKGGSGLGLAIGRELARAHGGDLSYEGGAFVLRLPCEHEPPDDLPNRPAERRVDDRVAPHF